jgi:hypothetical protein
VASSEFDGVVFDANHLRHSKFIGLRDDKDPRKVIKEHAGEG